MRRSTARRAHDHAASIAEAYRARGAIVKLRSGVGHALQAENRVALRAHVNAAHPLRATTQLPCAVNRDGRWNDKPHCVMQSMTYVPALANAFRAAALPANDARPRTIELTGPAMDVAERSEPAG